MSNLTHDDERRFIIIGGGPAGLTAGYTLTKNRLKPIILEMSDKVGGIARTENYKGYYFDMGGHRFFSKEPEVNLLWQEVMGDDFLCRPRLSRIYYNHTFFHYPLKPLNALAGLGLWQSFLVGLSYLRWHLFPYRCEDTFEEWVTNRFGKRLFNIFFKSYTEKVWGISTSELSADWAAQRIKNLDLRVAILSMFLKPKTKVTTLIEEFDYPRRGPGMMWAAFKDRIVAQGGQVLFNSPVEKIIRQDNRILKVVVHQEGNEISYEGSDFISSMPITDFIKKLDPPAPNEVIEAANQLTYRNFLTVCLIIDQEQLFDDNWIYLHDPNVKVGRIQNFKNWSPEMVPDLTKTSLGLEYFCNAGDEFWNLPDAELIELAKKEIQQVGLSKSDQVIDGCVFRVDKSYPVWDNDYAQHLEIIRKFVDNLENFQTVGRNGMHRYNNQDHSMMTALLAVRNTLFNENHDLWAVNTEREYHEVVQTKDKNVEEKTLKATEAAFTRAFLKLDPLAFGAAWGLVVGLCLCLVTFIVLHNQPEGITDYLWLISQYLPGYGVTWLGGVLGLFYGFIGGFLFGSGFAILKNLGVTFTIATIRRNAELRLLLKIINSQPVISSKE
jgi:protoporphyrinogen oxidase